MKKIEQIPERINMGLAEPVFHKKIYEIINALNHLLHVECRNAYGNAQHFLSKAELPEDKKFLESQVAVLWEELRSYEKD